MHHGDLIMTKQNTSEYHTQLAKMSFDEIFDLSWSVFSFFMICITAAATAMDTKHTYLEMHYAP